MDKQNFYQEKYEYYRTLNLWAVFGISFHQSDIFSRIAICWVDFPLKR